MGISAPLVDAYVLELPLTATSRNNHRSLLGVLFNFAVDSGYLLEVPITKKSKSKQKYGKPNIFTVEEAARLLSCCQDDILPAVALGLFTGLRPEAELWRLDWSKIHLDRKKIDVEKQGQRSCLSALGGHPRQSGCLVTPAPRSDPDRSVPMTGTPTIPGHQECKEACDRHSSSHSTMRLSRAAFCSYHYAALSRRWLDDAPKRGIPILKHILPALSALASTLRMLASFSALRLLRMLPGRLWRCRSPIIDRTGSHFSREKLTLHYHPKRK